MKSPLRGLTSRLKSVSLKTWLVLAVSVLLLAIGGMLWVWQQHRTVVMSVNYEPCEIRYGEVIDEWEGESEDTWNLEGNYYQARVFSLRATTPDKSAPNTIEAEPTRIATGGDYACQDQFAEEIDLTAAAYRYNGARASSIRFGPPPSAPSGLSATKHRVDDKPELATPVYGHRPQAAVWVDDGARASINHYDEELPLWCLNYLDCNDIVAQTDNTTPLRGDGYQFMADNCPQDISCSDDWYESDTLDRLITDDLVESFALRLEAVSTYASVVGTKMILVFKYPQTVNLKAPVTLSAGEVAPGASFSVDVSLTKRGPAIDNLDIEISDHPQLSAARFATGFDDQLEQLNREDQAEFGAVFTVASAATPGCTTAEVAISTTSGASSSDTTLSLEYCVRQPATTYSYSIATRGNTTANLSQFRALIAETLADSRGWAQADVVFQEVSSGGDFTLWLATPNQMTSFSTLCSPDYSCRVGRDVIINEQRWQNATDSWNQAGGSLRDYRHMVVNHEVGHFLGHGHYHCPGDGQLAPVMQQQSIDLEGCRFNPWPLPFEITST